MDLLQQVAANLKIEEGTAEKGIGARLPASRHQSSSQTPSKQWSHAASASCKKMLPRAEIWLCGRNQRGELARHGAFQAAQSVATRAHARRVVEASDRAATSF